MSSRFHERLHADAIQSTGTIGPLIKDGEIDPYGSPFSYDITGPREMSAVLHHRVELASDHEPGSPVPTDVCLWSPGARGHLACTKVGGDPYLGADREWPRDSGGHPMVFHFQINFADSRDICPDTPGDIVLVFRAKGASEMAGSERGEAAVLWQDVFEQPMPLIMSPVASPFPEFYAALVRENDYPEQLDSLYSAFDDEMTEDEEALAGDRAIKCSDLAVFKASKIGGWPTDLQGLDEQAPHQFRAQLVGIEWIDLDNQFVHGTPHPSYPDHEARRNAYGSDRLTADRSHERGMALGDGGVIHLFVRSGGATTVDSQSH